MERETQNDPAEHALASLTSCTMAEGQLKSPGCAARERASQRRAFSLTSETKETEATETPGDGINLLQEHQHFPPSQLAALQTQGPQPENAKTRWDTMRDTDTS